MPLRVVIADGHPVFLHALRTALSADPGIAVVAAATDLRAARSAVLRHDADALIVDAGLIEANGGSLGPLPSGVTVIVVGMDDAPGLAEHARQQGAAGYVVKDETARLVEALLIGLDESAITEPARASAPGRPPGRRARRPEPSSPPPAGRGPSAHP